MPGTVLQKMQSFQGVAAGQTGICQLPVGLTYTNLFINHKRAGVDATEAQMKAELGKVVLRVNGRAVVEATVTELLDIYKYYGYTVQAGVIPLVFARPFERDLGVEDDMALGTADVSTLSVEVEVLGGATTPTLQAYAEQAESAPLGNFITITPFADSIGGAGVLEKSDLPRGQYGLVALHIASALVTEAQLIANSKVVFEGTPTILKQRDHLRGNAWQTGYTHLNIAARNRANEALPMNLQDFRAKLTFSNTASFRVIREQVENFKF